MLSILRRALKRHRKDQELRQAERYLPDNIYTALDNFEKADWMSKLIGADVKTRYADLKRASADRCPRALARSSKRRKCSITTRSTISSSGTCSRNRRTASLQTFYF